MKQDFRCPLCGGRDLKQSWLGTIEFEKQDFTFYECARCKSFICHPMPDDETLLQMYGNSYFETDGGEMEDSSPRKFDEVLAFLEGMEKGVFIDYGCGDGSLLRAVAELGWKAVGVEFSPDVVEKLIRKTSLEIINYTDSPSEKADVIHLGDVLEHLTALDEQMPKILELLKTGGIFIAHGPLEANPNFFNFVLKISRRIKRTKFTGLPPYHVILATTRGQRALFERFGLSEINFDVREIAFPAPYQLTKNELVRPRRLMLFTVRKISQAVSSVSGVENLGNRYFYVGRKK